MFLLLLIGCVALQVWAWRSLRRRVDSGELTKLGGAVRFGTWALAPLVVFLGVFFGLVGLEELLGTALISEPMGRGVLPIAALLAGIAVAGWILFSVGGALRRRAPRPGT